MSRDPCAQLDQYPLKLIHHLVFYLDLEESAWATNMAGGIGGVTMANALG